MLDNDLHLNDDIFSEGVELKSTRQGFGEALEELGGKDENIVVLCADLKDSTRTALFAKKYPDRFIEMGIAEQNMAGVAAGMALSGKIPFIASYAIFNPGRNWEQIRLSICYSKNNVKIIGNGAGLSHNYDGGMAQCLEDIALTRVLPNMVVLSPCDYYETKRATEAAVRHKGPVYIRLCKAETPVITSKDTPFEIGKAQVILEGDDVTLAVTGPLLFEALVSARDLKEKHNISAEVINFGTIKPLDYETIQKSAKKTHKIFTLEDHQIAGGFGSAITEEMCEKYPVKVIRLGVNDKFGQSGTYEQLKNEYGLSSANITAKVLLECKKTKKNE